MSASYPSSVKSFTAKTDLVDDVMAVDVNGLQDEVAAIESDLLTGPQVLKSINVFTSWNKIPWTAVYVSATSIKFSGMNVAYYFPVGCKFRLTQTTLKYFYVISATYSGGDTTLVLAAGSDYSVTNAEITEPLVSYSSTAHGFPEWFSFTPSYLNFTLGNGTVSHARFCINGRLVTVQTLIVFGSTSSVSGSLFVTMPVQDATGAGSDIPLGLCALNDAGTARYYGTVGQSSQYARYGVLGAGGTYANAVDCSATIPFTWTTGDSFGAEYSYRI